LELRISDWRVFDEENAMVEGDFYAMEPYQEKYF
jgi:hypothetical protein